MGMITTDLGSPCLFRLTFALSGARRASVLQRAVRPHYAPKALGVSTSFWLLMSFRGGILIGTYSIARYCERHEILADDERTVIQCANTGFQLIMAGTLNVTAAYQRNM